MKDGGIVSGPYHGYQGTSGIPDHYSTRRPRLVLGTEGKVNPIASRKRGDLPIGVGLANVHTFHCRIARIFYQLEMSFILS